MQRQTSRRIPPSVSNHQTGALPSSSRCRHPDGATSSELLTWSLWHIGHHIQQAMTGLVNHCKCCTVACWTNLTVPERKFVTKIRVRYHDPRWRRQQPVRMFTQRSLLFRIVFHVFNAGYRAIVSYCFYVIPEYVIEYHKTAVNWCTKNT